MSAFRRWYQPGGTYFFTIVTYDRIPLFAEESARTLLGEVMRSVNEQLPYETVAIVLLPDHLHAIWNLPNGDQEFSRRWQRIKSDFTRLWRRQSGREATTTASKQRRGNRGVWQTRFWEHLIRDERDLEAHFDYIHYNPVKHGYVKRPWDWKSSTFRKYVASGHYDQNWGRTEPTHIQTMNPE
ncbi:MAG: transposase [Planctomycetaceae bacterium]|nr:transposase [Planctomycetaceae bacterium]